MEMEKGGGGEGRRETETDFLFKGPFLPNGPFLPAKIKLSILF